MHYLTEISIENKRQHAVQRGFDLVVAQNLAHGRTARWDKVMLLRRMLTQYGWLHWVDLDTLFMNMKRNPMDFLDAAYDLHVAKDANGLNTGSFYVRASAWSRDFLRRVWEHNDGGKGESDQRSFAHVIAELSADERSKHVKYYSQKLFNEYPDPIVAFKNWRGAPAWSRVGRTNAPPNGTARAAARTSRQPQPCHLPASCQACCLWVCWPPLFVGVLASAQATSVRETTCYTSLALSVASHRAVSTLTCISSRAFIGLPSILLQQCSHTHGMVYFTLLLLYPRLVEPGAIIGSS